MLKAAVVPVHNDCASCDGLHTELTGWVADAHLLLVGMYDKHSACIFQLQNGAGVKGSKSICNSAIAGRLCIEECDRWTHPHTQCTIINKASKQAINSMWACLNFMLCDACKSAKVEINVNYTQKMRQTVIDPKTAIADSNCGMLC